jgi:hypothetical protein
MTRAVTRFICSLTVLLAASAAEAARIEIQHQPLSCVPPDRFVRIAAKGSPPEAVRAAQLRFRAEPGGPWYAVAMKAEAGEWSAVLPRPSATLPGFEYSILMIGEGADTFETAAFTVAVRDNDAACAAAAQSAVSSSIVVRVPPGAPLVPAVPRGFNPTGVVAAQEREPAKSKKGLIIAGTAVAAAAMAALGVAGSSEAASPPSGEPLDVPDFTVEGTNPPSGSTISHSQGNVQLLVRMSREPREPLSLDWRAEWWQPPVVGSPFGIFCLSMNGTFNGAQTPTELILTGPLNATRLCGTSFNTATIHFTIQIGGRFHLNRTLDLPFRFEP